MENAVGLLLFSGLTAVLVWREGDRRMRASLRWLHRRGIGLAWRWRRATRSRARFSFLPLAVLALIAVTVAVLGLGIRALSPEGGGGALGTLGDFFGGILNPVIAAAALLALLHTIRIQQEELRLTRAEMKKSANALEAQQQLQARAEYRALMSAALEDAEAIRTRLSPRQERKAELERLRLDFSISPRSALIHSGAERRKAMDEAMKEALKRLHPSPDERQFLAAVLYACRVAASAPDSAQEGYDRIALRLSAYEQRLCWLHALSSEGARLAQHIPHLHLPPEYAPLHTGFDSPEAMLRELHPAAPSSPLS